jgi:hypothetical protein
VIWTLSIKYPHSTRLARGPLWGRERAVEDIAAVATKSAFRDCENCPQMLAIPAAAPRSSTPEADAAGLDCAGTPIQRYRWTQGALL